MIKDSNGARACPRQKAAEILLERLNWDLDLNGSSVGGMTERENSLVKTQMEKLHENMHSILKKAKKAREKRKTKNDGF